MRKDEVLDFLNKATKDVLDNNSKETLDASYISNQLHCDRSNVSRIINELWREGKIIKIAGRPVSFLSYDSCLSFYNVSTLPTYVPLGRTLSDYLSDNQHKTDNSHKQQDSDELLQSLKIPFQKGKAAVCYPPYGLNTLVIGKAGTGKNKLTKMMINYAIEKGVKNNNCPQFVVDCPMFSNSPEQFLQLLLNSDEKRKKSLLERSSNGFLVFKNFDKLHPDSLELLFSMIRNNYYYSNQLSKIHEIDFMIILTTSLDSDNPLINKIINYIPIVIQIEDIDNRSPYEKMQVVLDVFSKEARRTSNTITISKDVLCCFCLKKYQNNILQLENEIKMICSKAYVYSLSSYSKQIDINLLMLPNEYLETDKSDSNYKSTISAILNYIDEDKIVFERTGSCQAFQQIKQYQNNNSQYLSNQFLEELSINSMNNIESHISESISCLQNCQDKQLQAIKNNIDPYLTQLFNQLVLSNPQYSNLKFHSQLLYGIYLHITSLVKKRNIEENSFKSLTENVYPNDYQTAYMLYKSINQHYKLPFNSRELDYLTTYLVITNKFASKRNIAILVIAHGQNTAKEMVDYVKDCQNNQIQLDYINYTNQTSLQQCIKLVTLKATSLEKNSELVIMCDLQPLTSISEIVSQKSGIPCKSIYPLSLSSLLELVEKCKDNYEGIDNIKLSSNNSNYTLTNQSDQHFVTEVVNRIIDKAAIFIDCKKAVNNLENVLYSILNKIDMSYSNDLAVKFYCHCVSMLERVIKNEPWQYNRIKKYIDNHHSLMFSIEKAFEPVNNIYGIKIPQTELAYVAEIFEEYM